MFSTFNFLKTNKQKNAPIPTPPTPKYTIWKLAMIDIPQLLYKDSQGRSIQTFITIHPLPDARQSYAVIQGLSFHCVHWLSFHLGKAEV